MNIVQFPVSRAGKSPAKKGSGVSAPGENGALHDVSDPRWPGPRLFPAVLNLRLAPSKSVKINAGRAAAAHMAAGECAAGITLNPRGGEQTGGILEGFLTLVDNCDPRTGNFTGGEAC